MMSASETVRINIKKMRLTNNLTQEDMAEKIGFHRAYLGQIERGEKTIGINNLEKISNFFRVDITEFFKD